ncbi:MAG: hypothetical protein AMK75_05735 [Planctomycetes bacterium SM23_65]|nr:MAG: hypothetical protein AMK75_05735 [Planctomycetes bacterium SM23_65]
MPRQPEPEYMDEPLAAEAYALSDFSEVNQAFVDTLFELVGPLGEARAIDLGTGPGDIPLRIVRARPKWRVVAVEASRPMLELAKKAAREAGLSASIHWFQADAKDTGLPAHSFDVVFSNSILHHITETEEFWEEVKRLGKRGAFVLHRDLVRPPTREAAQEIVETYGSVGPELMQRDYYNSLLASYTIDEVRKQLDKAGLIALDVHMVTDRHWDVTGRV